MKPSRPLRVLLLSLACSAALAAQAQTASRLDIPAGDLASALDAYARQTGTQLVYRADQLRGARSGGLHAPADARALDVLLQGSGFRAQRDASGAVLIVPAAPAAPAAPARAPAQAAPAQAGGDEAPATLEAVQVTGSRIPRAQVEGPAPITIVTSAQIQASGLTTVPEVLRSLSQNSGSVQGQQNTTSAQSTPGAQAVDLRGLGPNHTLVLVNGRRIADFPLPLNSRSNFTDVGNIPLAMIDRIEVLTGSASAVYGSDAMAGVINFILKKSADGTTIDYRYGGTQHGGGESHDLALTTGFDRDAFSGIVGLELIDRRPLWGTERGVQDSTLDAPTERRRLPRLIAQVYDWDDDANLAPPDDCAALAGLNGGTTVLADDRFGEPYCGSERAIAYRTIQNERRGFNAYGSFEYRFSDALAWFADLQLGQQTVRLLTGTNGNDVASDHMGWEFHDPLSTDNYRNPMFFNAATGHYEVWSRQFTPEEVGGLEHRMNSTVQKTLALTTGLNGSFGQGWNWETAYNHSEYKAEVKMPRIRAAAANQFFLGDLLGYDDDGYAIYDADPTRLFTPLTPAEFASFAAMSTWHPVSRNDNLSFTADNASLFSLPAGDVGFAGALEYGSQSYRLNPDPLALTDDAYYGPRYGDGHGSRDHWGAAGELRVPLLSSLQASLAGRYDRYQYGDSNPGKFTYSLGMEWRPHDTLLVRGSYGTGFRAPDMHYLFAGNDYYRTRFATDYYHCRTDAPGMSNGDCYDDGSWDVSTFDVYNGNMQLDVETSRSFTAGFVWSPTGNFDLAVDYYRIRVMNQVQSQDRERLRIEEADCRLGMTDTGVPVDINSPTCIDALARVIRDDNGDISSVHFSPINIASEQASGIDVTANYRLPTRIGDFRFNGSYTWARRHTRQQYPGDPVEDMLDVSFSDTTLPRAKGNLGANWEKGAWAASLFGTYLGRVANYDNDAWTHPTWRFNAGARYDVTDHLRVSLTVDNLFDQMPPRDATWGNYPYYDTSWFDSVGRSYYLQFTWKLGGAALR
ncbi:MAG: TonB-dependent receptor domain-containing protein [Lysobacteraceae bacterium]